MAAVVVASDVHHDHSRTDSSRPLLPPPPVAAVADTLHAWPPPVVADVEPTLPLVVQRKNVVVADGDVVGGEPVVAGDVVGRQRRRPPAVAADSMTTDLQR